VSDSNCVYRNVVDHAAGEFTQVLFEDVASDPTLPRTKSVRCAACGHGEAVFFQVNTMPDACLRSVGSESRPDLTATMFGSLAQATARGEEGMTLFFVCCNPSCGHRWRE
jgi:DNA-directed RNA polymerase II subunit RPB9